MIASLANRQAIDGEDGADASSLRGLLPNSSRFSEVGNE